MSLNNMKYSKNITERLKVEDIDYDTLTFCVGKEKEVKEAKYLKVKFQGRDVFLPIRGTLKCDCEIPEKVQNWFNKRSVEVLNEQVKEDIASLDYYYKFMESMSDLE